MLMDRLTSDGEDSARLRVQRQGRSSKTQVIEGLFEVLRKRLERFFEGEDTLW